MSITKTPASGQSNGTVLGSDIVGTLPNSTDRISVLSYVDFTNLANNTDINNLTPQVGAIFTNPASAASVQNGFLTPTTTSVYYARQDHANVVNKVVIEYALNGTVTLTIPSLTIALGKQITLAVQILHLQTTPSSATLMLRQTGIDTNEIVGQFAYSNTLLADGTIYRLELSTYGDRVNIAGPNGENWAITDKRVLAYIGNSSFFEANIESNASYCKVKRFYSLSTDTTNIPQPYKLPNELETLSNFAHNNLGNPSVFAGTPAEISFYSGVQGYPAIGLGPSSFFSANVLAAITIGDSTFSIDAYIPAGSYTIDTVSANGANKETITVTAMAGATSPYTATISGTFAKSHTANTRTTPVTVISTTQASAKVIALDQFGLVNLPDNIAVNGNLRLRNGGDYYSTVFHNVSTNYAQLYDIGPNNPTSLGVTGGYRVTEGSNRYAGIATLVAGTVTISNTSILTGDRVTLHRQTAGGTLGHLSISALVNATSFTILSSSVTETSTIYWEIRRPG